MELRSSPKELAVSSSFSRKQRIKHFQCKYYALLITSVIIVDHNIIHCVFEMKCQNTIFYVNNLSNYSTAIVRSSVHVQIVRPYFELQGKKNSNDVPADDSTIYSLYTKSSFTTKINLNIFSSLLLLKIKRKKRYEFGNDFTTYTFYI